MLGTEGAPAARSHQQFGDCNTGVSVVLHSVSFVQGTDFVYVHLCTCISEKLLVNQKSFHKLK